jgi:hypothetical protein
MPDETKTLVPPYVSFGVFKSTVEQLADAVVPSGPLDRRVLPWLSGADYPALISALRFLGLITDDNKATPEFRRLVAAVKNPEDWKVEFLALLKSKYDPIISGVNLEHGTIGELEKRFKDYGVSAGQMVTKSIRFLVKALTDAKVPLSPYIIKASKPRAPRTAAAAKNGNGKARRAARQSAAPAMEPQRQIPDGVQRMPVPGVANGFIEYPTELTTGDCDVFAAVVTMLRAYVTARTGGKEKKA